MDHERFPVCFLPFLHQFQLYMILVSWFRVSVDFIVFFALVRLVFFAMLGFVGSVTCF